MNLRSRRKAPEPPALAFCEPVTATALGRWHVRRVGAEGRKPHGGIPASTQALCGRDVSRGWDLVVPVDPSVDLACARCVDALVTANPDDGPNGARYYR